MKFTTESGTAYVLTDIRPLSQGYTGTIERLSKIEFVSYGTGENMGHLPDGGLPCHFMHLPKLGQRFSYTCEEPFSGCLSTPVTEITEE